MILLGDTNCDLSTKLTSQSANCDTKRIRALYDLFSFKQLIVEPTRKMKHFNEEAFVVDVAYICWEQMLLETDDINVLLNDWSNVFSIIIEKHALLIEMRVSEKYCPWINKDLKNLMKTRDKLKKGAVKTKSIILMESYRHMRNKVNALNIKLKKQFYTSKTSACKGYMKETWETVHEILHKR